MRDSEKETNREKHQFKSYYCVDCKQRKPCRLLTRGNQEWQGYCCLCYFQRESQIAQEYNTYKKTLANQQREKQETWQELKQLRAWKESGKCSYCGNKAIQPDWLLSSELVCGECGKGHVGNCFTSWQKWFRKRWGVNVGEWLDNYDCLPINANCARKWLADSQHLNNCVCLEQAARETYQLFTNSLKESEEKLKKCACESSSKPRTPYYDSDNYGYTYCENCEKRISGAGKHGTIKNRNNPTFWGLKVKEKVLCEECLKNLVEKMPVNKKYTFNKYQKRGYWK